MNADKFNIPDSWVRVTDPLKTFFLCNNLQIEIWNRCCVVFVYELFTFVSSVTLSQCNNLHYFTLLWIGISWRHEIWRMSERIVTFVLDTFFIMLLKYYTYSLISLNIILFCKIFLLHHLNFFKIRINLLASKPVPKKEGKTRKKKRIYCLDHKSYNCTEKRCMFSFSR